MISNQLQLQVCTDSTIKADIYDHVIHLNWNYVRNKMAVRSFIMKDVHFISG